MRFLIRLNVKGEYEIRERVGFIWRPRLVSQGSISDAVQSLQLYLASIIKRTPQVQQMEITYK